MDRKKMVAYLRKNMAQHSLQALKDDLINRQGHPLLEVEAAAKEALQPEDPLRRLKAGLLLGAVACMFAALAIQIRFRSRPAAAPAPEPDASELAMPDPALPAMPQGASAAQAVESGLRALRASRPEDALARFDEALGLDPLSSDAHIGRASALIALGRAEEAGKSLDAAEKIEPGRHEIRQLRALIGASALPVH